MSQAREKIPIKYGPAHLRVNVDAPRLPTRSRNFNIEIAARLSSGKGADGRVTMLDLGTNFQELTGDLGLNRRQFEAYNVEHGANGSEGSTIVYVDSDESDPLTVAVMDHGPVKAVSVTRLVTDSLGGRRIVGVVIPFSDSAQTMPYGEVLVSMGPNERLYRDRDIIPGNSFHDGTMGIGGSYPDVGDQKPVDVRLGGIVITPQMFELTGGHAIAMVGMTYKEGEIIEFAGPPQIPPQVWDLPETPAGIRFENSQYIATGLSPLFTDQDPQTPVDWQPWTVSVPANLPVAESA